MNGESRPSGHLSSHTPGFYRPMLCVLAVLGLAGSGTARAAGTFYVDGASPACSEQGAGTSAQPYCSISAAVAARGGPGTRIVVRPGTYREQVSLTSAGDSTQALVLEASGAVTLDGADDLSSAASWSSIGGGVWRAAAVNWNPKQVFSGADRLAVSTAAPAAIPSGAFRYVAGQGLYVNLGNAAQPPASLFAGRRLHGFRVTAPWIEVRGFTVLRTEDRSLYLSAGASNVTLADNTIQLSARSGIHAGNVSFARIQRNRVSSNGEHGISLSAVTDAVIEGNESWLNAKPENKSGSGLYLSQSIRNRIGNNRFHHNLSSGVYFQTSSNDNVSTQNLSWDNGRFGFDHVGSTGNHHVGDVAWRNATEGFAVQGGSTGTTIHDGIAAENGIPTSVYELWVDASSAAGFSADYNLYWKSSGKPLIRYAAAPYATPAALAAATGHETHGLQGDPRFVAPQAGDFHLAAGSPAIDAATSSIANWPELDAEARARIDVSGTANSGTGPVAFADRGALEYRPPNQAPVAHLSLTPSAGTAPLTVAAAAGTSTDADGGIVSYRFDFGDGSVAGPQPQPSASHVFATGTWRVRLTIVDDGGLAATDSGLVVVGAPPGGSADGIHWTFLSTTSIGFDWRGTATTLRYGSTPAYDRSVTAAPPDPLPFSSPGPYHEAVITGLTPNTVYHYAIGDSADHTFHTPPVRGSSGFTVYAEGDIGSTLRYPRVAQVQALIAAARPDFSLLVGDLTYGNDHGQGVVDRHFNDMMVWSQDAAYMPAWGNHEWDKPTDDLRNYKGRFVLPNPQASPGAPAAGGFGEDWYWFDYGNVRFIGYPEPYPGAWADWFPRADSLMDAVDADGAIDFIVTFGHRPAFSSGHHSGSNALKNYLNSLGSSHPKYVLNLNGHSHNYERTHPQSGVVHITAGGGGSSLESDGACGWAGGCPPPSWSAFRAMHHGPLKLRFTETGIEGTAICGPAAPENDVTCTLGSAMDSFTIGVVGRSDLAPSVTAPAHVDGAEAQPIVFTVSAADPDGDPIATLSADLSGLPSGSQAQFVTSSDRRSGTLTWTPGLGSGDRSYEVSFTGANALSGSATVTIAVARANRIPDAALEVTPASGFAPLLATVDASASTDLEGPLASYRFDFGDGSVAGPQASPYASHTYGAGVWTARVRVTDQGGATDSASVTVNALRNLVTNSSFETNTTGWNAYLGSTIARVPGGFDGSYALEIRGPLTTAMFGLNDAPDCVSPALGLGARYRYSAFVRSATGRGAVSFQIREFKNGVPFGSTFRTPAVPLGTEWREVNTEYTVAYAGTTLNFQIIDFPSTAGEVFQVDRVVIYLIPPDRAPVVVSPSQLVVNEGESIAWDISASDPDGDPIGALSADLAALPEGNTALYEADSSQTSGHLAWTPDFASAGTYTLSFTAANAREGSASTTLTVLDVNRPPVIDAPAQLTIPEGAPFSLVITAHDPDSEPLTFEAEFEGFPADHGATFTLAPTGTSGTLAWTPAAGLAGGPYVVELLATNSITTDQDLEITVTHGNRPPSAVLAALPSPGVAPFRVTLDASGSSDPDADSLAYSFEFGDGATQGPQASAFATHNYATGTWGARVIVDDGHGGRDTATTTVVALRNLTTNPSFETNMSGWNAYSGATLARVAGGHDGTTALQMTGPATTAAFGVNDSPNCAGSVAAAGTRHRFTAWVRSAASLGNARLQIREYLGGVQQGATVRSPSLTLTASWQKITTDHVALAAGSTIDFQIVDYPVAAGEIFLTDEVSVVVVPLGLGSLVSFDPQQDEAEAEIEERWAARPLVVPNPLHQSGMLRFGTAIEGPVRVTLFDMQGRRLRTVADLAHARAGNHAVPLETRREDGARLAAGVYFYRVENAHGMWSGRFLVVR